MHVVAKTFYCPDIVSQEDGIIVEETLRNIPGIEEVSVDPALHTVYASTTNPDGLPALEWALRDAGFPPHDEDEAKGEVGSDTADPQVFLK